MHFGLTDDDFDSCGMRGDKGRNLGLATPTSSARTRLLVLVVRRHSDVEARRSVSTREFFADSAFYFFGEGESGWRE